MHFECRPKLVDSGILMFSNELSPLGSNSRQVKPTGGSKRFIAICIVPSYFSKEPSRKTVKEKA